MSLTKYMSQFVSCDVTWHNQPMTSQFETSHHIFSQWRHYLCHLLSDHIINQCHHSLKPHFTSSNNDVTVCFMWRQITSSTNDITVCVIWHQITSLTNDNTVCVMWSHVTSSTNDITVCVKWRQITSSTNDVTVCIIWCQITWLTKDITVCDFLPRHQLKLSQIGSGNYADT